MLAILMNVYRIVAASGWLMILSLADSAQALGAETAVRLIPKLIAYHDVSRLAQESSRAIVTSSSLDHDDKAGRPVKKSYRRIGSADIAYTPYTDLPSTVHCGIVNHIEFFDQSVFYGIGQALNPVISGFVAMPFGRQGDKSFFANVETLGISGYTPIEKNIDPVLFSIGLTMDDGNYYVITQRSPPRFQQGDTVMRNRDGLLERANCMPNDETRDETRRNLDPP